MSQQSRQSRQLLVKQQYLPASGPGQMARTEMEKGSSCMKQHARTTQSKHTHRSSSILQYALKQHARGVSWQGQPFSGKKLLHQHSDPHNELVCMCTWCMMRQRKAKHACCNQILYYCFTCCVQPHRSFISMLHVSLWLCDSSSACHDVMTGMPKLQCWYSY